MVKKTNFTEWEEYQRTSKAVRKKFDDLVSRTGQLAASKDADSINMQRVLDTEMKEWEKSSAKFQDEMTKAQSAISPRRDATIEQFASKLKHSLETGKRLVFGESETMVVDGVVHIDLNMKAGLVKINGENHRDLRVDSVVAAVTVAIEELEEQTSDPEIFKKQLLQSYEYLISRTRSSFSSQVKMLDLLPLVAFERQKLRFHKDPRASNYSDYPLTLFRADFYNLLARSSFAVGGFSLKYAPGSTTDGAVFMYVPSLKRTAHLGRIWFEESQEENHARN